MDTKNANAKVEAKITAEYLAALKKNGLYEKDDPAKIAALTKEREMRAGKGYSAESVRNFLLRQCTCTTEMLQLIQDYYEAKHNMKQQLGKRQADFINELQTV